MLYAVLEEKPQQQAPLQQQQQSQMGSLHSGGGVIFPGWSSSPAYHVTAQEICLVGAVFLAPVTIKNQEVLGYRI